jgi:tetratricopeptide (TPR) repeat protein
MKARTLVAAALVVAARAGWAQTAADHIAMGDQAYVAMNAAGALQHYEAALAVDSMSVEALYKAARQCVDLGEFNADEAARTAFYARAEKYARRAVAAGPNDADAHFHLARSLGRAALAMGARDRIKYGKVVRVEALAALKINPKHPGALHVMGMWNAEIMRLNGFTRMIAKTFLGGQIFSEANWENAQKYLEQAVEIEPHRLTHHLDLGKIYVDVDNNAKAKVEFEAVVSGTVSEFNDPNYKKDAQAALAAMK